MTTMPTNHDAFDPFSRSVLVVEDDDLLRELIAVALEGRGFRADTAATAADAKRLFSRGDHDALVIDVNLGPGPTGFDLAEALRQKAPHVAIVFLTNLPDPRFAGRKEAALPSGVAYLRKSLLGDVDELLTALDVVLRGQKADAYRQDRDPARPLAALTSKQLAVIALAAQGKTNAQIAAERGVSVKAIEDTLGRAAQSMGIDSETEGNLRVAVVRRYLAASLGDPSVA